MPSKSYAIKMWQAMMIYLYPHDLIFEILGGKETNFVVKITAGAHRLFEEIATLTTAHLTCTREECVGLLMEFLRDARKMAELTGSVDVRLVLCPVESRQPQGTRLTEEMIRQIYHYLLDHDQATTCYFGRETTKLPDSATA